MFHQIPPKVLARMAALEERDAHDRQDGPPVSRASARSLPRPGGSLRCGRRPPLMV